MNKPKIKQTQNEYELLAVAIVEQAVIDYRKERRKLKDLQADYPGKCKEYRITECEKQIAEIEDFFCSGWCDFLCDGKGEYILEKLKKEFEQ